MLLDDDVVTDGKAKARAFTGWLGCEERIEHLLLRFGRDAGAVVAYPDLDAVAEASGCGSNGRLETFTAIVPLRLVAA